MPYARWLLAYVGLFSLVGCAEPTARHTPAYPVSWNAEASGGSIRVKAGDDLSFAKDVVRMSRLSREFLEIHLVVSNHTGREIFVAALDKSPGFFVRWVIRTVSQEGDVETREGRTSGLSGVGPGDFIRLCPWPAGQSQVVYDRPLLYDVHARVPLHQEEDTQYTDVAIEIPLHYYALGCTKPADIVVRRTMRVQYTD